MKKIAIAQVVDSTDAGGAERVAIQLANAFAAKGMHSHLIVTRRMGALSKYVDSRVRLLVLNRQNRIDLRSIRRTLGYIRNHGIDILHAHGRTSAYWCIAWKLLGRLAIPVIFHDHTGSYNHFSEWRRRTYEFFDWILLSLAAGIIGISEYHFERARRLFSSLQVPIILIQNGIAISDFATGHQAWNRLLIVQTANIRPQKGHSHVVDICYHLSKLQEEFEWLCIGNIHDAQYFSQIAERLTELGLEDKVQFLGMRTDIPQLLSQATVAVLTSEDEGMPLALLEYMAAGLPVVVTDVADCRKIVESGGCGFVIPRGRDAEFARAIAWLYQNPSRAKTMGMSGRKAVIESYSVDKIALRLLDFYTICMDYHQSLSIESPRTSLEKMLYRIK